MDQQTLQALVTETMKTITWPLTQPNLLLQPNLLQFPFQTWPYTQPLLPTPPLLPFSIGPFGNMLANPFLMPQLQMNQCSVIRKRQHPEDDKITKLVKKSKLSTSGPISLPPRRLKEKTEEDEIIDVVTIDKSEKFQIEYGVFYDNKLNIYGRDKPRDPRTEPPHPYLFLQEYSKPDAPKHPKAHLYPDFTNAMIHYLEDDFWTKRTVPLPKNPYVLPFNLDPNVDHEKNKKEAEMEEKIKKETDTKK